MKLKLIVFVFIIFFVVFLSITIQVENSNPNVIKKSEKLIDAFYSFNSKRLNSRLAMASSSKPLIIFYQGWAKAGNYKIIKRMPCKKEKTAAERKNKDLQVSCSITVKDDLMKALDIDFNVTDTFHLSFRNSILYKVTTSSNDLQVFRDAEKWVWSKHPELVSIPCKGYFKGGLTPEDCVTAMIKGYKKFKNSSDFPQKIDF